VNILLDENLDWRLRRDLPDHAVEAVPLIGWAGLKNGALLRKAQERFDVLVRMDSNMVHHQNLAQFRIAVIPLQAQSNRLVGKITRWPDRDLF
jgi:predicted nuclease of predicted toxin-antitoxin system